MMKQNGSSVNSIEKALRILLAFQTEHPSWGVRELSAHLGFSPATVQRALQTLKAYGFVNQDPDTRQYRLGNVFFRNRFAYLKERIDEHEPGARILEMSTIPFKLFEDVNDAQHWLGLAIQERS